MPLKKPSEIGFGKAMKRMEPAAGGDREFSAGKNVRKGGPGMANDRSYSSGRTAGLINAGNSETSFGKNAKKVGTTVGGKMKNSMPKQKKIVPSTWTKDDLASCIVELETKTAEQKNHIQFQKDQTQRNDEFLTMMKQRQEEPKTMFQNYKDEVGQLGDETGNYEMEIKYYNSLAGTSDVSKNMAETAYHDNVKYGKSLTKTLTLLEGKTARQHHNHDIAEWKKAVQSLQEERDKEDYLAAKMEWYQDQIEFFRPKAIYDSDRDPTPDPWFQTGIHHPDYSTVPTTMGNGKCVLPPIKQQEHKAPAPEKARLGFSRPVKLPPIPTDNNSNNRSIEEDLKLPVIGITKTVSSMQHIPSPPPTPRKPQKFWRIFNKKN